jgi:hypothetical protein
MIQRHQSVSPAPSATKVVECQSAVSSEPTETVLSEVKKEGNYVLLCKVNNVLLLYDIWFTEILYKNVPEYKVKFCFPQYRLKNGYFDLNFELPCEVGVITGRY